MAEEHPSGHSLASGFLVGGGRFTLLRQLGVGGMSVVWMAQDERLNEPVALKFLPEAIRADAVALNDLRQETQKSRRLTHPNIVRIYDLYEAPGEAAFISMEFIDGPNLHDLKQQQLKGFFGWVYLKPLVKQLCEAMDYAHSENVIHRDLKPANMMLDSRERLKLADFGIASVTAEAGGRHRLSGTLTHMGPQQIAGAPPQVTDDIYALGATLYELLCGQPPFFEGDIAYQVKNNAATPLQERLGMMGLRGDVPPAVGAMIMACLAKDPKKRPQSARLVAEWIGLADTVKPTATEAPPRVEAPAAPIAAPKSEPVAASPDSVEPEPTVTFAESEQTEAGSKKVLFLLLAGSFVALAVVGLTVWHKVHSKPKDTATTTPEQTTNTLVFDPAPVPLPLKAAPETNGVSEPVNTASDKMSFVDTEFDPGLGPDEEVRVVASQTDGKVLAGGMFKRFNGEPRRGFVRLKPDGSLDGPVVPKVEGDVYAIAVQSDGKILLGGSFGMVNGERRRTVARLNPDLTLDKSFDAGNGANTEVRALLINHGKIFVGGPFRTFDFDQAGRIVQLDAFGHKDPGFTAGEGLNGRVWGAAAQPNGMILIGGDFNKFNGTSRTHLARINAVGQVDPYFNPRMDGLVYAVTVQPDRRIVIGGLFSKVNGMKHRAVARLNPDGAADPNFDPVVTGNPTPSIQAVAIQADGKVIIGGVFNSVNGIEQGRLARLNQNGTLDRSFAPKVSGAVIRSVAPQRNGKVIAGGGFRGVDGMPEANLTRLNSTGSESNSTTTTTAPDHGSAPIPAKPMPAMVIGIAASASSVRLELGGSNREAGLHQLTGDTDGTTTPWTVDGSGCRLLANSGRVKHCYFKIDPGFEQGETANMRIEVEFYDGTPGVMEVEYAGGTKAKPEFTGTARKMLNGDREWRTEVFHARRLRFRNGGADFRLMTSCKELYVRRVVVAYE